MDGLQPLLQHRLRGERYPKRCIVVGIIPELDRLCIRTVDVCIDMVVRQLLLEFPDI